MARTFLNADGDALDIPDEEAADALAAGLRPTTRLTNDTGDLFDIPDGEVQEALDSGLRFPEVGQRSTASAPFPPHPNEMMQAGVPVPDNVQAAGREAAEGVAEQAPAWGGAGLAGLEGFARGATLGLSDMASAAASGVAGVLGGPNVPRAAGRGLDAPLDDRSDYSRVMSESRDAIRQRKEEHATAAGIGELTGAIAGAALPVARAAGAVGKVGRTLLAPAAKLNQTGAKVATSVAARLAPAGSGVLRSYAARGAGVLAQGAAEGAVAAAAEEVNAAFLRGEYKTLAEKLPASAVRGAFVGAGLSAALGGAIGVGKLALKGIGALGKAARASSELGAEWADERARAVVSEAQREAAEIAAERSGLESAERTIQSADDFAQIADERVAQLARKEGEETLSLVEQAAAAHEYDDLVLKGTQAARRDLNEVMEQSEYFDEFANRRVKQYLNEKEAGSVGFAIRDPMVTETVTSIGARAKEMLADGGAVIHSVGGGSATLKQIATISDAYMARVNKKLDAGAIGEAYNELDNMKLVLGRLQRSRDGLVKKFAEDSYEQMRTMLEADVWESLAERQKVFNAVVSKEISAWQAAGLEGLFVDSGRKNKANPWLNSEVANDAALKGLFGELGSGVELREDSFRQLLGTIDASLTARANTLQNPQLIERAAKAREAVNRVITTMDRIKLARKGAEDFARYKQDAASGLVASIPVVGRSGAALNVAGLEAAGRLHAAERVARREERKLARDKLERAMVEATRKVEKAADVAKLWTATGEAARAGAAVGRRTTSTAGSAVRALDAASEPLRRAATRKAVMSTIREAEKQAEQEPAEDHQSSLLGAEFGAELGSAYADQARARAGFLLEKAGPRPAPSVFGGTPEREIDDETVDQLERYIDAADDPLGALERMGAGDSTAEDAETLSALYPGMLQEFRRKAVASLAKMKEPLPYEQQLAVAEALGVPLTADGEPAAVAFWQGVAVADGAQQEPASPERRGTKSYDLPADKALSAADRIG